jgi:hypothetical protein
MKPRQCYDCGSRKSPISWKGRCKNCYDRWIYRQGLDTHFDGDDMTQEQVDALVAEQMRNLPSWWHNCLSERKQDELGRQIEVEDHR